MKKPPLDPNVTDLAPADPVTTYDEEHLIRYLRLLDADADGADWRDVSRIVLHIDPDRDADRARQAFESHLSRARWMTEQGYRPPVTKRRLIVDAELLTGFQRFCGVQMLLQRVDLA